MHPRNHHHGAASRRESRCARSAPRIGRQLTTYIHGTEATNDVENAAAALFNGNVATLPRPLLTEALAGVPTTTFSLRALSRTAVNLVDLLCMTALCESKREARELLNAGAVTVNGKKSTAADVITKDQLLHGHFAAIRKGKRTWHLAAWQ